MDTRERRVIVEVRGPSEAIRRAPIEPGQTLRVGRGEQCGLVLAGDDNVSPVHFELGWGVDRQGVCRLRDLGSAKGTLLQGAPVKTGEVTSGAWIRAGDTDLTVYFEEHTPPPARPPPAPGAARAAAVEALAAEAQRGQLFALVDAARSKRALVLLRESVDVYDSLYQGLKGETMADYAPYLVQIRGGSRLLPRLVEEGWGDAWGVYLTSKAPLRELRAHFRRLLFVQNEELGELVYFRFYDPRVLRVFLPVATRRQEDELFGPVERFLCEDEDRAVTTFARATPREEA